MQSLFNRCNWMEGAAEALIQQCLPPCYQLAWRTIQHWINKKEVVLYSTTDVNMREEIFSAENPTLERSVVEFVVKPMSNESRYRTGQFVQEDFFSHAHYVYNSNWEQTKEFAVSFFLAKDYNLSPTTKLFVLMGKQIFVLDQFEVTVDAAESVD